jgi:transposase
MKLRIPYRLSRFLLRLFSPSGYWTVEQSRHFNHEEAKTFLDGFKWDEETAQYHRSHLNRCLATMDRLWGMPKESRVLEIGAPPYGMTLLMLRYLFDSMEATGFEERDESKAQWSYVEERNLRSKDGHSTISKRSVSTLNCISGPLTMSRWI